MKEWRCFHCDYVTSDPQQAALHFGERWDTRTACTDGMARQMIAIRQANARAEAAEQKLKDKA